MCISSRRICSERAVGQLLNRDFIWALLLLKSSQKENKFGRTDNCFVFWSRFSMLQSGRDEQSWFKWYCCDSAVRRICIHSDASLPQNAMRKGGNLILLWLWRSAEKRVHGVQSSGRVLVRQLRVFNAFVFFQTWCQMLWVYFPISFC